jgi:carbonic anhydrase
VAARADQVTRPTGADALHRLVEGNARFVRGEARALPASSGPPTGLVDGQHPWATILGCSDSRVPPELIFDAGFGELFVIRIAGNLISPEVAASLQYAATELGTPVFVVLGHEGCGAVKAALAARHGTPAQSARIHLLLESIQPALDGLEPAGSAAAELTDAVEANVLWSVRRIQESPDGRAALAVGQMIVGGVYELASGRIRILTQ